VPLHTPDSNGKKYFISASFAPRLSGLFALFVYFASKNKLTCQYRLGYYYPAWKNSTFWPRACLMPLLDGSGSRN
jgi:hypothetical protein